MTKPITEPTQGKELSNHGYRIRQLERRPAPQAGPWIYVGDAGAPAFQNSWANVGGVYTPMRFRSNIGAVDMEGAIVGGAAGTVAFTLPVGYRPSTTMLLDGVDLDDAFQPWMVESSGDVTPLESSGSGGGTGAEPVPQAGVHVSRSNTVTPFTIPSSVSTDIPWQNFGTPPDYDTDGFLGAPDDTFLTIPMGLDGVYEIVAQMTFDPDSLTDPANTYLNLNVTGISTQDTQVIIASAVELRPLHAVDHVPLSGGDVITMAAFVVTDDASSVNLDLATLALRLLGPAT